MPELFLHQRRIGEQDADDLIISARVVRNVDEAIEHIRKYGTRRIGGNNHRKLYKRPEIPR